MTEVNTNMSETLNLGREASRRWGLASSHGDAGDANAIVALVHAERVMTFSATVERKKEETAETFDFNVTDLANPYYNNDGSKDTRKMSARSSALALRLFDISELTNAIKTRLARCIKVAVYLINSCSHMTDEELFAAVRIEKGKLSVPYGLVAEEPAEDASAKDKAVFKAMQNDTVQLDGKDGLSLAELSRRANPPKDKRAAGESKDKGASLVASVEFVSAVVRGWNNPDGETDNAPSRELERQLFALSQEIASYFAANPIGDEDEIAPPVADAA